MNPSVSPTQWAWRALFALCLAAVVWLALTPAPPQALSTGWDKANHALAFVALSVSGLRSFVSSRSHAWLLALLFVFGGAIELGQTRVPGRSAEWGDWLADSIGLAAGMAALALLGAVRRVRDGQLSQTVK